MYKNNRKNIFMGVKNINENRINNIVSDVISKLLKENTSIKEDKFFEPKNNEWDRNYFQETKLLLNGMINIINAMEDDANSSDSRSTKYLFKNLEDKLSELKYILPLIKNYFRDNKR